MNRVLAIGVRGDITYALVSDTDREVDFEMTKHRSIMEAISYYADVLGQGTKLVVVGYGFSFDEKMLLRHYLYIEGLKKDIHLVDFNEAFVHYCVGAYEKIISSHQFKSPKFVVLYEVEDRLCLTKLWFEKHGTRTVAFADDECINNFDSVDFYDDTDLYIDGSIQSRLPKDTYGVVYCGNKYRARFKGKIFRSDLILQTKEVVIDPNIFIIGAFNYIQNMNIKDYVINTRFKPKNSLTLNVVSAGVQTELELIGADSHFYDLPYEIEVITYSNEFMEFFVYDRESNTKKGYKIYIGHLVKGANKPTRLRISLEFLDNEPTLLVRIEDIGFGYFVEASRMRVTQYIDFGGGRR